MIFENTVIITILCTAILFLYLNKPRRIETFTKLTNSRDTIQEVIKRLNKIFDKHFKFTGTLKMLNNRDIMKEITIEEGKKSFTINKKNVYLCLKDTDTGAYYDINSLMYVALHEIAHVLCQEIGHTELFAKIFKAL